MARHVRVLVPNPKVLNDISSLSLRPKRLEAKCVDNTGLEDGKTQEMENGQSSLTCPWDFLQPHHR
jgi:hypothetical protein